jgi:hypothetical protein
MIKSRRIRKAGHVARKGRMRNAYKIFVGKPREKTQLGGLRRIWEDNIRMDLGKIVWAGMDWMYLAVNREQRRAVVNKVTNLWVP